MSYMLSPESEVKYMPGGYHPFCSDLCVNLCANDDSIDCDVSDCVDSCAIHFKQARQARQGQYIDNDNNNDDEEEEINVNEGNDVIQVDNENYKEDEVPEIDDVDDEAQQQEPPKRSKFSHRGGSRKTKKQNTPHAEDLDRHSMN